MSDFLNTEDRKYFEEVLSMYKMNEEALKAFKECSFSVIAGPAGAGKDTIRNKLVADNKGHYHSVISTTTRDPRLGEIDGVDYHFRQVDEIKNGIKEGKFFQAALVHNQQISCLSIEEIEKLDINQVGVSILIVQTEAELSQIKNDIRTVFVVPPSLEEMKRRMNIGRTLTDEEEGRRLKAAHNELIFALNENRYQCLVNDNLSDACSVVHNFLQSKIRNELEDKKAREIIEEILQDLG